MKTTLELPGDLLRRTKAAAALRGVSMRDFIAEALEGELAHADEPRWRKLAGRGKRLGTSAVTRVVKAEFSKVDRASWK